jgi:hypothetical protein
MVRLKSLAEMLDIAMFLLPQLNQLLLHLEILLDNQENFILGVNHIICCLKHIMFEPHGTTIFEDIRPFHHSELFVIEIFAKKFSDYCYLMLQIVNAVGSGISKI